MELLLLQLVKVAGRGFVGENQEFSFTQFDIKTFEKTTLEFGREIQIRAINMGIEALDGT